MSIEKGKITGLQLLFLVTAFIQGSVLLTAFTEKITKHDTWIVILSGLAVAIPFAAIYGLLAKRFSSMNLIQINDVIYGKYLGKLISIYYIYYFLMTFSFNLRDLGNFYTTFLMPETPLIFFLIVFTLACAFTVYKGIEVLARVSHLFVAAAFFIIISTFLFLLNKMNFSNFLPVFEMPLKKFIQGTHIIASIPFGEIIIFLPVMASLKSTKYTVRNFLLGLLMGGITLFLITIRNTAVLGSTEAILTSPSFHATRLIDIGNVFTRMDILIGIGQTIVLFLKCSIYYYALVLSISHFLRLKSYLPLILPIGSIVVIISTRLYESVVEHTTIALTTHIFYLIPLLYIFPPMSLLIAGIRGLPKQERGKREVPNLTKKKCWRELIAFSAFYIVAFILGLLYVVGINIPNPFKPIEYIIIDVLHLKY